MALRLLGRKLMIVKPQELGFCFNNSYRTAATRKLPLKRPAWGLRDRSIKSWLLLRRENRRLEEENCRLEEEKRQLRKTRKSLQEGITDLRRDVKEFKEGLEKDEEINKIQEEAIDDFLERVEENLRTKLKEDASDTINHDLLERVRRLEQKILGDLQHDIQNERDRCKSLETKLEEALRKIVQMNKEQHNSRFIEENLVTEFKDASNTTKELIENVRRLEQGSKSDYFMAGGRRMGDDARECHHEKFVQHRRFFNQHLQKAI
ncbi:hypothetical protein RHMOL_Rhmol12G0209700 [Rhododendron molle]|uniref:Uncharacterized protein n=1 Tax=Rhododendron molle TaxID=49168 RepID=A0ACC0LM41_RHOML|nr:hypothetical protein RHMOL_Rhmol12G0209700 [Rhododendron molle]